MKKNLSILIVISLLISIVFIPVKIEANNSIYYYSPYPQGTIALSQPEIGWTIFLGENKVESVVFLLNGNLLNVKYDEERKTYYGYPEGFLTGQNNVKAVINLKNWANVIEKSWSFTVNQQSIGSLPYPNEQQLRALNYANDYRYFLDLPLFQFHNSLNMAAQKHADYQAHLNYFSHYQTEGSVGFFGRTVGDRVNYYGFFGNIYEDISYQSSPSAQSAIDNLFDAPYHRIPFLILENQYYGYGFNKFYHVLNFGGLGDIKANWVAYPGIDHENIPIAWENYEIPDPLRFYDTSLKKVGYPIVVGVYGNDIASLTLISANLWDEENREVPIYINSPKATGGNDDNLSREIIIIPKAPLELLTKYKVSVVLEVIENGASKIYDNTWFFTTENIEGNGKAMLHQYMSYPPTNNDSKVIQYRVGQRFMRIDNKEYPLDVVPFIENNRTMVPIRALGNSLGAYVDWDENTKTVIYKKEDLILKLPVGTNYVNINGTNVQLDQGAIIKGNRSYVPIRFVSEQLGAYVEWISSKREVLIIN